MKKKPAPTKRTGKSSIAIRNLLNNLKENELHYENKQITQCVFLGVLRLKPVPSAFTQVPPSPTNLIRKKLRQVKNNTNSNNIEGNNYASKTTNRKIINGKITKKNIEKVKACVKKNPIKKIIKVKFNMNRSNSNPTVSQALSEPADNFAFNPVDSLFNKMKQHRLNDTGKVPENPSLFQQSSPSTSSVSTHSSLSGKSTKVKKKLSPAKSNNSDKDDVIFVSQTSPGSLDSLDDTIILDSPSSSKRKSPNDDLDVIIIDDPSPIPSTPTRETRVSPRGKRTDINNRQLSETINLTGDDNPQEDSNKSESILMQLSQTQNVLSESLPEKPKPPRRSRLLPALPEIFLNTRMLLRSEFTQKREATASKPKVKRNARSLSSNTNSTSRLLPPKKIIEDVTDRWEIRPVSSKNQETVNHEHGLKLTLKKTSKNCNQPTSTSRNQETQTDKVNKNIEKTTVTIPVSASPDFINNNSLPKVVSPSQIVGTSPKNAQIISPKKIDEVIIIDNDDKIVKKPVQSNLSKSKSKMLSIDTSNKSDRDCVIIETPANVFPSIEIVNVEANVDDVPDMSPRVLRSSNSPKKTEAPSEKQKTPPLQAINISMKDTIVIEDDVIKAPADSIIEEKMPTRILRSSVSPQQKDVGMGNNNTLFSKETEPHTVARNKDDISKKVTPTPEAVSIEKTKQINVGIEQVPSSLLTFAIQNTTDAIENNVLETPSPLNENKIKDAAEVFTTDNDLEVIGNVEEKRVLRSSVNIVENSTKAESEIRDDKNVEQLTPVEPNSLAATEKSPPNKKGVPTNANNFDEITVLKNKRGRKPKEPSSRLLRSEAQSSHNTEKEIETEIVVLIHDEPKQKLLPSPAYKVIGTDRTEHQDPTTHDQVNKAIIKIENQENGYSKMLRSSSSVPTVDLSADIRGQVAKDTPSKLNLSSKSLVLQDKPTENEDSTKTPVLDTQRSKSQSITKKQVQEKEQKLESIKTNSNKKQKSAADRQIDDNTSRKRLEVVIGNDIIQKQSPVLKKDPEALLQVASENQQTNKKPKSVAASKKKKDSRKVVSEDSESPSSVKKCEKGKSKVSTKEKKPVKLTIKTKKLIKIKLPVAKRSLIKSEMKPSKATVVKKNESRKLKNVLAKLNKTAKPKNNKPTKQEVTAKAAKVKNERPKKIPLKIKKLESKNVVRKSKQSKITQKKPIKKVTERKSKKQAKIKLMIKGNLKRANNHSKSSKKVAKKTNIKRRNVSVVNITQVAKNSREANKPSKVQTKKVPKPKTPSPITKTNPKNIEKDSTRPMVENQVSHINNKNTEESEMSTNVLVVQTETKTVEKDSIKPIEENRILHNCNAETIINRKPLKRKSKESDSNQTAQKRRILRKSENSTSTIGTKHDITVFDFTDNDLDTLPPSRFYKLKQETTPVIEKQLSTETIDLTNDKMEQSSKISLTTITSSRSENDLTENSETKPQKQRFVNRIVEHIESLKQSNSSLTEQKIEENIDLPCSKTNLVTDSSRLLYSDLQKRTVEVNVFTDFHRRSSRSVVIENQNINNPTNETQQKAKKICVYSKLNNSKNIPQKTNPSVQTKPELVIEDDGKICFKEETLPGPSVEMDIDSEHVSTTPLQNSSKSPTGNPSNIGSGSKGPGLGKSALKVPRSGNPSRKQILQNPDSHEQKIESPIASSESLPISPSPKKTTVNRQSKKLKMESVQLALKEASSELLSCPLINPNFSEEELAAFALASNEDGEQPVFVPAITKQTQIRRKLKKQEDTEVPNISATKPRRKESNIKANMDKEKSDDVPRDVSEPTEQGNFKKPPVKRKSRKPNTEMKPDVIEPRKPSSGPPGTPKKQDNDDRWLAVCGQLPKDAQHPVESACMPQSTTPSPKKSPMKQATIIDMFKKMSKEPVEKSKRNVFAEPQRMSRIDQHNREQVRKKKEESQLRRDRSVQRKQQSASAMERLAGKEFSVQPEKTQDRSSQPKEVLGRTRAQSVQREQPVQRRAQSRHRSEGEQVKDECRRTRERSVQPKRELSVNRELQSKEEFTDFLSPSQNGRKDRARSCIARSREPSVQSRSGREQSVCREYNRRRSSLSSFEDDDSDCESRMEWMPEEYAEYKFKYSAKKMMACKTTTFTCKICLLIFPTYYMLNKHKIKHLDVDKPYKCQQCEAVFSDVVDFNAHMRMHNGKFAYSCRRCGEGFWTKVEMEQHKSRHILSKMKGPDRKFPCNVCGREFTKMCDVERHVRVHTGEKPAVCNICNKSFQQVHNLSKHLLIHLDYKPFACEICDKKFGRSDILDRHLLTHSVEKPIKCDFCTKDFIRLSQLKSHIKSRHPGARTMPSMKAAADSMSGRSDNGSEQDDY